ncbi:MAG: inorganic diphosphatase [Alphaproteobacteria bacterium]|nr:inorganic diphosphatase [Alphaproteobacteria bacterium]
MALMNYKALPTGRTVPTDINALIEIAKGGGSIKYEFDRHSGALIVDRLRDSSMNYPVNYGCIPQTLSEDGDPLDVLVLCDPIQIGTVMAVRPVGVLIMDDEKGHDVKIIAVPADRLTSAFKHIQKLSDIPEAERQKIEHFFAHYKDLEGHQGRNSKVSGWKDVDAAHEYIFASIKRAKAAETRPLTDAAQKGDIKAMQALLDGGLDINAMDDAGRTALTVAALRGHADVVKFLIDKGAKVDEKNVRGNTALMIAEMVGFKDIAAMLKAAGALPPPPEADKPKENKPPAP